MSKRKAKGLAALVALILVIGAYISLKFESVTPIPRAVEEAVQPKSSTPTPQPSPQQTSMPFLSPPFEGQRLTIGLSDFPVSLDPHLSVTENQESYILYFDALLFQGEDGSVTPWLAESWQLIDPLTWEFKLREGVRFHNGEAFDAEAVRFSFERVLDVANALPLNNWAKMIKKVEVIDKNTVRLHTESPDPLLLKRVVKVWMLPPKYLTSVGPEIFGDKPVGTGAFRLKEYVAEERQVAEATGRHPWRKPRSGEVILMLLPEAKARVTALKTGSVDLIDGVIVEQVSALESSDFLVVAAPAAITTAYGLDVFSKGPLGNKLVRQAMNFAIDKERILKDIYGQIGKVEDGQLVQPFVFGYNPMLIPYPYDLGRAKILLQQAGFPKGFQVVIEAAPLSDYARGQTVALQAYLADVGIRAEFRPLTMSVYRDKFYRGPRAAVWLDVWTSSPALDADLVYRWYSCGQPEGMHRYCNEEWERVYQASRTEMDTKKREELLQRAAALMWEDAPVIFMIQPAHLFGVRQEVHGFTPRADGLIWLDPVFKSG